MPTKDPGMDKVFSKKKKKKGKRRRY